MRACFKDGFLLAVKNKASFTLRQACLRGASEPTRQPEVMEAGEEASIRLASRWKHVLNGGQMVTRWGYDSVGPVALVYSSSVRLTARWGTCPQQCVSLL